MNGEFGDSFIFINTFINVLQSFRLVSIGRVHVSSLATDEKILF